MLAQKAAELVLELVKSTHSRLVSDVRSTEDTETPAGDNLKYVLYQLGEVHGLRSRIRVRMCDR